MRSRGIRITDLACASKEKGLAQHRFAKLWQAEGCSPYIFSLSSNRQAVLLHLPDEESRISGGQASTFSFPGTLFYLRGFLLHGIQACLALSQ